MKSNSAVILAYHRVAQLDCDPQWLAVPPQLFNEQIDVLARRWQPISLADLARAIKCEKIPERAVAVTFDDGYADNWTQAAPILKRHNVPATIFVTTHGDAPDRELWWDELERLILAEVEPCGDGQERFPGAWNVTLPAYTPRRQRYVETHDVLRRQPAVSRWAVLEQLRQVAGLTCEPRASHRLMTRDEIASAADTGLIEIGAHTVTHPVLAMQAPEDQRWEMATSRSELAEIIGRPIESISYPYGGRLDYTPATVALARSIGFSCACANQPGLVTTESNLWAMPRVLVRDWDGEEFERRVERAFASEAPAAAGGGIRGGVGGRAISSPHLRTRY